MDYGFTHQNTVYTPNQTFITPEENESRNAAIDLALIEWMKTGPRNLRLYVKQIAGDQYHLTTWLGHVVAPCKVGNKHRQLGGGNRRSVSFTHHGFTYRGWWSCDNWDSVGLWRTK